MTELTEQQRRELGGPAPTLIDPQTGEQYVLVRKDVYERVRALLGEDDGPDMRQVGKLVEQAMREDDENDPTLAYYQQKYGKRR